MIKPSIYTKFMLFEGTQVSVGRGTDLPFQIGSPWTKNLPYQFTRNQVQEQRSFLNGKLCYGENLSDYRKDLRELNLEWVIKAYTKTIKS
jgi:uncharacterized protein YbbC (DUF1343 family)